MFEGASPLQKLLSPSCKEYISISWRGGLRGVRLRPRGLKPEGLKNNLHIKLPKEEAWKRL